MLIYWFVDLVYLIIFVTYVTFGLIEGCLISDAFCLCIWWGFLCGLFWYDGYFVALLRTTFGLVCIWIVRCWI